MLERQYTPYGYNDGFGPGRCMCHKDGQDTLPVQAQHRVPLGDRARVGDLRHRFDPADRRLRDNRCLREEVACASLTDQDRWLVIQIRRHLVAHPAPKTREKKDQRDREGDRKKGDRDLHRLGEKLTLGDRNPPAPK